MTTSYAAHVASLEVAYAQVMAEHRLDAIVVVAGRASIKNRFDDQWWPLAVTPTFAHWLPLREADSALVIAPGVRPKIVRVHHQDYWDSPPRPESDHFWPSFEVVEVADVNAIPTELPHGRVAVLASDELPFAAPGPVNPPWLVTAVERLRTRKSPYELACLAEATRRAVRGHRAALARFEAEGGSELALHLDYLSATEQDDGDTPYKNIFARGRHAAVLHHVVYDKAAPAADADSLLVDAGAACLGYASDITRTHARGAGDDVDAFRALVAAVEQLQQQVCREIRPGLAYEALHDRSHELLAEALVGLGLGRGSAAELVARGVTRALFPHGLGHSLGLQVHDVGMKPHAPRPDNRYLRNTSVIEVGQVFTIEPGCYFIDQLLAPLRADDRAGLLDWKLVERIARFGGVRIEDDVVVGETGIRNLTREAWAAA
ncbi:MAG TPA: Xaa-Pro dipeptidase [Kofleriaceae bacterium]|nr:Xaa-Pro dipeptidase [Kofleriaceae bacterium]